jgi:hypothetical protein
VCFSLRINWEYFFPLNLKCHGNKFRYCTQIRSWSLRGVSFFSAVRGSTKHAGGRKTFYWSAIRRRSGSYPNCKHRAVLKHCNSLVHYFLWVINVFTLDSDEHYFRSRNCALPQDSHSLRGSTRDPWTVYSPKHIFRPFLHSISAVSIREDLYGPSDHAVAVQCSDYLTL